MDLRDLWRPAGGVSRLTWRRLGVLIRFLPPESATKTAMRDALPAAEFRRLSDERGDEHGPWSKAEMLLASLLDAAHAGNWQFLVANSDGKSTTPEFPTATPRPGIAVGRRMSAESAEWLRERRDQQRGGETPADEDGG